MLMTLTIMGLTLFTFHAFGIALSVLKPLFWRSYNCRIMQSPSVYQVPKPLGLKRQDVVYSSLRMPPPNTDGTENVSSEVESPSQVLLLLLIAFWYYCIVAFPNISSFFWLNHIVTKKAEMRILSVADVIMAISRASKHNVKVKRNIYQVCRLCYMA